MNKILKRTLSLFMATAVVATSVVAAKPNVFARTVVNPPEITTIVGYHEGITDYQFTIDGKYIEGYHRSSTGEHGAVALFDLQGNEVFSVGNEYDFYNYQYSPFMPKSHLKVHKDGQQGIINFETGKMIVPLGDYMYILAMGTSPDRVVYHVVMTSGNKQYVYDIQGNELAHGAVFGGQLNNLPSDNGKDYYQLYQIDSGTPRFSVIDHQGNVVIAEGDYMYFKKVNSAGNQFLATKNLQPGEARPTQVLLAVAEDGTVTEKVSSGKYNFLDGYNYPMVLNNNFRYDFSYLTASKYINRTLLYGVIDAEENVIVPFEYQSLQIADAQATRFLVEQDNETKMIDRQGNVLHNFGAMQGDLNLKQVADGSDEYIIQYNQGQGILYGIINRDGTMIHEPTIPADEFYNSYMDQYEFKYGSAGFKYSVEITGKFDSKTDCEFGHDPNICGLSQLIKGRLVNNETGEYLTDEFVTSPILSRGAPYSANAYAAKVAPSIDEMKQLYYEIYIKELCAKVSFMPLTYDSFGEISTYKIKNAEGILKSYDVQGNELPFSPYAEVEREADGTYTIYSIENETTKTKVKTGFSTDASVVYAFGQIVATMEIDMESNSEIWNLYDMQGNPIFGEYQDSNFNIRRAITGSDFYANVKDADGHWSFVTVSVNNQIIKEHTVSYQSDGKEVASQKLDHGQLTTLDGVPTLQKGGYDFMGWYLDEACTQKWDFSKDTVTDDIILYAGWCQTQWSHLQGDITIFIDSNGHLPFGTQLVISPILSGSVQYRQIAKMLGGKASTFEAMDIHFVLDEKEIQPTGEVTITMSIPKSWDSDLLKVYHVTSDDNLEDKAYTLDQGKGEISFLAADFSPFVIAQAVSDDGDNNNSGNNSGSVHTGDNAPIIIFVLLLTSAGIGALCLLKKRKA